MALTDALVFYATMGATNPPWTNTDYVGQNNLTAPNGLTVSDGNFGDQASHFDASKTQTSEHADENAFDATSAFTLAFWFRPTILGSSGSDATLVQKGSTLVGPNIYDYSVTLGTLGILTASFHVAGLSFDGHLDASASVAAELNKWSLAVMTWDGIGTMTVSLNAGQRASSSRASSSVVKATDFRIGAGASDQFAGRFPFDGDIQRVGIWKRVLSRDEELDLFNGAVFPFAAPKDDCDTVLCCEEPLPQYNASEPTPSGAGNTADLCNPVPTIDIQPASGNTVTFPTYVFLTPSRPDVTIYYTTDGSVPTTASTVYTAPFQITSSIQFIQAIAVVSGCLPGPIAKAQYKDSPTVFKFGYSCNTTDKMGQWGQFAPNGVADYHWTLQLKLPAATVLKRIELYQTNAAGVWNSGQAWSTDEFINPKEGPAHFHVFPLGVFDDGLNPNVAFAFTNQLNSAYLVTFKTLAFQTYLWTLIGQPAAPLNGFFKLLLFLGDGTVMESIIGITCGDPPPPCAGPAAPTLTPVCSGIDIVTTANTDGSSIIGKNYVLLKAIQAPCGDGVFRSLSTGVITSNPQTFHDTGLTDGCTYCYALQIDEGIDCGLKTSPSVCAQPKCMPQGALSVTPSPGCYPVQVTVAWSTACVDDGVTQTRIVQEASTCAGQVITNETGNDDGSMSVTINCDTIFTLHYGNACLADQTISHGVVIEPAFCDDVGLPASLSIQGYNANTFFDISPCESLGPCNNVSSLPSWNGVLTKVGVCEYSGGVGQGVGLINIGGNNYKFSICSCQLVFDGTVWRFSINFCTCTGGIPSGSDVLWQGTKSCGHDDPTGKYTRLAGPAGGCSTLASIMLG